MGLRSSHATRAISPESMACTLSASPTQTRLPESEADGINLLSFANLAAACEPSPGAARRPLPGGEVNSGATPSPSGRDEFGRNTLSLWEDRKSTRLNSSHLGISYAVFCLK